MERARDEGLISPELRVALERALEGETKRLDDLLARHGGLPGPRPNHALASALGAELCRAPRARARGLLSHLLADDSAPDQARVFLSVAGAFAAVALLDLEPACWSQLAELATDERAPVRVALIEALSEWGSRQAGRIEELVDHGREWLEAADLELRFGAAAVVLDVLADRRSVPVLSDPPKSLSFLEQVIAAIVDAPRAAERRAARRRSLAALPGALAALTHALRRSGAESDDGIAWLEGICGRARHPNLRAALEMTIDKLRQGSAAQPPATLARLREALESSAKPPRDPSRIRHGARGRGKKGHRTSR